jgi:hypothetical protein
MAGILQEYQYAFADFRQNGTANNAESPLDFMIRHLPQIQNPLIATDMQLQFYNINNSKLQLVMQYDSGLYKEEIIENFVLKFMAYAARNTKKEAAVREMIPGD